MFTIEKFVDDRCRRIVEQFQVIDKVTWIDLWWNGCENFKVKNYVRNVDNFRIINLE